jgi:hypothetical protein
MYLGSIALMLRFVESLTGLNVLDRYIDRGGERARNRCVHTPRLNAPGESTPDHQDAMN